MEIQKLDVGQADYDYDLIVQRGDKASRYQGAEGLKQFKTEGMEGITVIGWDTKDQYLYAQIKDGDFLYNGLIIRIDFGIVTKDENGNSKLVKMEELNLQPIYFRRVNIVFAPDGQTTTVRYAIGFKTLYEGKSYQKIMFINDDGSLTLADKK